MRIGLTNEFFPPAAPGGAEWSMYELGQALANSNHHVVVITPNYGAKPFEIDRGMHIYRYPFPHKLNAERQLPGFIWYANLVYYLYSAIQIYKIARKEKLQIIHAQNKYSLPGSWLAAQALRIPIVTTIRDTSHICRIAVCLLKHDFVPQDCSMTKLLRECSEEYYQEYYQRKSLYLHLKDKMWQIYHWWDVHFRRFFLNSSDLVISVSNGLLEVYKRSQALTASKTNLRVVYNIARTAAASEVVNIRDRYNLNSAPIVLYAGKFSRGKGSDDFVGAANRLLQQSVKANFIMLGSGKFIQESGAIRVYNKISHEETLEFIRASSIVVVPSVWPEPLSRVILEALSMGKPVVGTNVGGTPEAVIDTCNGLITPKNSPVDLAIAIEKILSDPKLAKSMSVNAIRVAQEKFSRDVIRHQIETLYQECINKRSFAKFER